MVSASEIYLQRTGRTALYYIAPIANISSILHYGILSHEQASRLVHQDISMSEVQRIRAHKDVVIGVTKLHQYANLYFDARNPMMYKRHGSRDEICVLEIATSVLDFDNTVVSDQNAASSYARFYAANDGMVVLDFALVLSRDWRDTDSIRYFEKKSRKCAEVLVLNSVPPQFITGIIVHDEDTADSLLQTISRRPTMPIKIDSDLFFS